MKKQPTPPDKLSAIDEVLSLQKQLDERKRAAVTELLQQRKDIDTKLRSLGHGVHVSGPSISSGQKPAADRYCPICELKGHDKRAHRWQEKKKAFTQEELAKVAQ